MLDEYQTLDTMVATHGTLKMLNWWEGEDPFQIIVETIATQQCKLIQGSSWAYELKLMADEATGGTMAAEVEAELDDWLRSENTIWEAEAAQARGTQDWDSNRVARLRFPADRLATIAVRSLWA